MRGLVPRIFWSYEQFLQHFSDVVTTQPSNLDRGWELRSKTLGLLFRSVWLSMAPQKLLIQSQCACRDTPETNSILFEAFDEVRAGCRKNFGIFQCDALQDEPNYLNWQNFVDFIADPHPMRCLPLDIMLRCACALRASRNQEMAKARQLLQEAVQLLALALDYLPCFQENCRCMSLCSA